MRSIIRLRPRSVKGESDAELHAVEYDISSRLLWVLPGEGAPVPDRRQFDADGMIGPDAGADAAFGEVRDCVESVLAGTPGCVVAYGAHGTGKTRTLFAPDGLAALAARVLFAKGEPTRISVQFIEIYFELLADLLDASSRVTLREGGNKTQLYGTASTECASADDVENAIATGQAARRADCARSSAVLVLHVSSATTADSVPLYFVDLSSTDGLKLGGGADGVALAPPTSAYASLHTFERTLHVLSDRKVKIKPPIRESRLTRVLANVFSAGGKMCVLVHIALGAGELALTLASLDFAQLAMRVSLKEAKNEKGLDNDTVTKNLQSQIDAFDESSAKRHGEVEAQIRAEMARAAGGAKNAAELRTAVAAAHKVYASLLDKVGKGRGAEKANGQPAPDPEEVRLAEETHKTIMEMRAQIDAARKLRDEVTVMLPEIAAEYRELGGHAWHSGDTAKTRMYYDKVRAAASAHCTAHRRGCGGGGLCATRPTRALTRREMQALVAYTKCMGKDHPEVACSMGDLANVYCDEGRFDEAIELYQKAYKVHNDAYGPDHVDTAGDLASLGLVYSVQGKHKQALPLLKCASRGAQPAAGARARMRARHGRLHVVRSRTTRARRQGGVRDHGEALGGRPSQPRPGQDVHGEFSRRHLKPQRARAPRGLVARGLGDFVHAIEVAHDRVALKHLDARVRVGDERDLEAACPRDEHVAVRGAACAVHHRVRQRERAQPLAHGLDERAGVVPPKFNRTHRHRVGARARVEAVAREAARHRRERARPEGKAALERPRHRRSARSVRIVEVRNDVVGFVHGKLRVGVDEEGHLHLAAELLELGGEAGARRGAGQHRHVEVEDRARLAHLQNARRGERGG